MTSHKYSVCDAVLTSRWVRVRLTKRLSCDEDNGDLYRWREETAGCPPAVSFATVLHLTSKCVLIHASFRGDPCAVLSRVSSRSQ